MTWIIVASVTVSLFGDQMTSASFQYKDVFVNDSACNEFKRSDEFLESRPGLIAIIESRINNPHARIDIDFACVPVGQPV